MMSRPASASSIMPTKDTELEALKEELNRKIATIQVRVRHSGPKYFAILRWVILLSLSYVFHRHVGQFTHLTPCVPSPCGSVYSPNAMPMLMWVTLLTWRDPCYPHVGQFTHLTRCALSSYVGQFTHRTPCVSSSLCRPGWVSCSSRSHHLPWGVPPPCTALLAAPPPLPPHPCQLLQPLRAQ